MRSDEMSRLLQAERAVRPPPQAFEQGLTRLLTGVAQHAAPLPVATGALDLGWSMASKWLAIGFLVGLGGAGAAAHAWAPQAVEVATNAPSARPAQHTDRAALDAEAPGVPVEATAAAPVRSERPATAVARDSAASAPAFDAELRLITAAKSELDRGRSHLASAWLDDHAQRFPAGVFAIDREALRVLVRCSQQRNPALARHFATRFPGSPMVERLLRACGKVESVAPRPSAVDFPK